MQLFYSQELNPKTQQFIFNAEESKHIIKVLRKKQGDVLQMTNGKGLLFNALIQESNPKQCVVKITSLEEKKLLRNYHLHVAISPTKHLSRFEWFLEKATEIGIDEITPLICERSNHKKIKLERCKSIVQGAAKQSLQFYFPIVNKPIDFLSFMEESNTDEQRFIAHCKASEQMSLKNAIQKNKNTTILIGPEGDFSEKEITAALRRNFQAITLGSSRLRTETAGIVSIDTVCFVNQE